MIFCVGYGLFFCDPSLVGRVSVGFFAVQSSVGGVPVEIGRWKGFTSAFSYDVVLVSVGVSAGRWVCVNFVWR